MKHRLLACSLFLLFSANAQAQWTNPGKVTYLHPYSGGINFALDGVTHGCGSSAHQFQIDINSTLAEKYYSLLLVSLTSEKQIAANYTCQSDGLAYTDDIDIRD